MATNFTIPQTTDFMAIIGSASSQTGDLLAIGLMFIILLPILFLAYKYSGDTPTAGLVIGILGIIINILFFGMGIITTTVPFIICIVITCVCIIATMSN